MQPVRQIECHDPMILQYPLFAGEMIPRDYPSFTIITNRSNFMLLGSV